MHGTGRFGMKDYLMEGYTILVDTREPVAKNDHMRRKGYRRHYERRGYYCSEQKLDTGDYSIDGFENTIAVERKALPDLMQCMTHDRRRFEQQLTRGLQLEQFCVVVEGRYQDIEDGRYRSQMHPNAATATIQAFRRRYRCQFIFCDDGTQAAQATLDFLNSFLHDHEKGKRPFITYPVQ